MESPDIILPPKKNVIFDATLLSSLMACARFHDIRFNHRLVQMRGKSNSLETGSLVHKVLEVFYKHKIDGWKREVCIGNALIAGQLYVTGCPHCGSFVEDICKECEGTGEHDAETIGDNMETYKVPCTTCKGTGKVKPSCGHEPEEYPGVFNTPEKSEGFVTGWRHALDTCEKYFKHYENDSFVVLAAEAVRGEIIYEDDEIRVMFKAKFDTIIDTDQIGIVSMDHKTYKQRRDKSSLSNQFSAHCVLLNARYVLVNKIGLQSSIKIEDRLVREIIPFSKDRLDEWRNEIVPYWAYKYIQYQEANSWPPSFTSCDTMFGPCAYKQVCEADRNMREEILRNEYKLAPVWDPKNRETE